MQGLSNNENHSALSPGVRSHTFSAYQTAKLSDKVISDNVVAVGGAASAYSEMARLIKQMPKLLCDSNGHVFRLSVPTDVDMASACLDPSWFVNIIVTIMDRNGTVIYHEA